MSKFRKLLIAVGILAVPAVAYAASAASAGSCCAPKGQYCRPTAACSEASASENQIVCPINGETIPESECPLCKGAK